MWLGGSISALSGFEGWAYGMTAFGLSAAAFLADQKAAYVEAQIIKDNAATPCRIGCLVTADGALRLRVPLLRRHLGGVLALPLANFLRHGLIRGLCLQRGNKLDAALGSDDIEILDRTHLQPLQCRIDGWQFTALRDDAHLLVTLPDAAAEVTVLTLTILPLPPVAGAVPAAIRGAA